MRRSRIVLVIGSLIAWHRSDAQGVDSLPVRAKQWGVEFTGGDLNGAGVLRFLSARRALVVDVSASLTEENVEQLGEESDASAAKIRLGHRWYRASSARIAQFATLGVTAYRSRTEYQAIDERVPVPSSPGDKLEVAGAGAYMDVGATWWISPHVALSGAWTGSTGYYRSRREVRDLASASPRVARERAWSAEVGALVFRVNLFF